MNTSNSSRVEEIWTVLREEILRGQYRPGERLPSERELAVRFGANRGAVREALKKLEQIGIADITPGGVRVVPVEEATLDVLGYVLDLDEIPDPTLIRHVLEVLGALMSMSARTAIEAASDDEIDAMRSIVQELRDNGGDSERDGELWKSLGHTFTQVNDNLVLRLILNGLKTQFVGRMGPPDPDVRLDQDRNRPILDRIDAGMEARDPEDVADAVEDHFRLIRDVAVSALTHANDNSRSVSNG
ncbi:MAG: GntR family transcriptional regulator [Gammaproteobacteria bacterium]|nr:GntR family transcriptional regulator [Gammaproteobacteria bacterium]